MQCLRITGALSSFVSSWHMQANTCGGSQHIYLTPPREENSFICHMPNDLTSSATRSSVPLYPFLFFLSYTVPFSPLFDFFLRLCQMFFLMSSVVSLLFCTLFRQLCCFLPSTSLFWTLPLCLWHSYQCLSPLTASLHLAIIPLPLVCSHSFSLCLLLLPSLPCSHRDPRWYWRSVPSFEAWADDNIFCVISLFLNLIPIPLSSSLALSSLVPCFYHSKDKIKPWGFLINASGFIATSPLFLSVLIMGVTQINILTKCHQSSPLHFLPHILKMFPPKKMDHILDCLT